MESLDEDIRQVINKQPEITPEGKVFSIKIGDNRYTKKQLLDNWDTDETMRKEVRENMLHLKLHLLGGGP